MNENELRSLRFFNQQFLTSQFSTPEALVQWFGAVQAQDYYGALWGLGLRLKHMTQTTIEKALEERKIVRSWPMRGTLHFTPAEDLKWMLQLLAPRITTQNVFRYRQLGLDEEVFAKAKKILAKTLQGNKQLSRPEIYKVFNEHGITTDDQRGIHILGRLAREYVICFGFRHGKQQTFALFDEWIPVSNKFTKEEALAELAKRYFRSHGPATLRDFIWWSGLTVTDARVGLESIKNQFENAEYNNNIYWFIRPHTLPQISSEILLLPSYDEYTVAYKDRSAVLDPLHAKNNDTGNGIFHPPIVIEGQVVGLWKRVLTTKGVKVKKVAFRKFTKDEEESFTKITKQYANFIDKPLLVQSKPQKW